ncbi:MAG TPA: hydrogenase nickel incorporation protein HypB [Candidatus Lokiarchaeia archaeon]|nr:hydrogenase nickel incorporation protein HypB [Candidatus Lokiarchaeia archaeon]
MENDDNEHVEPVKRIIELNDDLLANNEALAQKNAEICREHGMKTFDIVGAIGAGKTLILEKLVERLASEHKILVINGDVTLRIDADRIEKHGAKCIQINTGHECALNAYHIYNVLKKFDISGYDLLFIENVGNLICPSDFVLGADMRIVIVSITEGEHVIRKHPLLFKMSQIAVINKIDLLPHLEDISVDRMIEDALKINPNLSVITLSAKTGEGLDELLVALNI